MELMNQRMKKSIGKSLWRKCRRRKLGISALALAFGLCIIVETGSAAGVNLQIESVETEPGAGEDTSEAGSGTVDGVPSEAGSGTVDGVSPGTGNGTVDGVPSEAGTGEAAEMAEQFAEEGQSEDMTEEAVMDEQLALLLQEVQDTLPVSNGSWSVYVCDLKKDAEGSIGERRQQAASLIKLYIMGAVYQEYESLAEQYGQSTIDSYLYSMITVSDNEAANVLTTYLGDGDASMGMMAVNEFCMEHGYTRSSMGRLLLYSNENGDNYTSVEDCGHFLKAVYENDETQLVHTEDMYNLLKAQTRRNKIPAQMPEGVSVANKTGELSDVENDAAILYDTDNDLVIVFMSESLLDAGAAQSTIASVSRQIYDYYSVQQQLNDPSDEIS